MKNLIIFFIFAQLTIAASFARSSPQESSFLEQACYELADWHDHSLEDLGTCIENGAVLSLTASSEIAGAEALTFSSILVEGGEKYIVVFHYIDGYITYMESL